MPLGILLVMFFVIGLPAAWFAAEFQDRRWLRISLGAGAILMSFGVFHVASEFKRWEYNIWYSEAAAKMLDAEISALAEGRSDAVLSELRRFRGELHPTYEYRGNFDQLAEHAAERINTVPD